MCIECLILIASLFVCTSCELLGDKPVEIRYTPSDKLNVVVFLNNIPRNIVKYRLTNVDSNDVTVEVYGNTSYFEQKKRIVINNTIERDQQFSVQLLKASGNVCSSRDVLHVVAEDFSGRESAKHKCLVQNQACHIQIDFEKRCDESQPVIVQITSPRRYEGLNLNASDDIILYFSEYETFDLKCHQNNSSFNTTWNQRFPINKVFLVSDQIPGCARFMLQITLRWFDDGTVVFCTGMDGEISTRLTFKLQDTQPEVNNIETVHFNELKPVTRKCSKDKRLIKRYANGNFKFYEDKAADFIDESDNGSMSFCMRYKKHQYKDRKPPIFKASREIDEEVTFIYQPNIKTGSSNVAIWATSVIVVVVVIASWVALLWYKRRRLINRPLDPQEHIYESIPDVVYAELNTSPCTGDKPNRVREEAPYAKIIGVLKPAKDTSESISASSVK